MKSLVTAYGLAPSEWLFCFCFPIIFTITMASSKEKAADEKNLKILRELASLPTNKFCFDCQQRGPTYVNVTTGSFVCTSCSGLLRGLTPPHRIKSITMTSFTPEEMDLIRNKGNEYCKSVWLGKYDTTTCVEVDYQNVHSLKEFLIQKYEDKKFYVEPELANFKKSKPKAPTVPSVTRSQTSTIETKPHNKHILQKTGWMSQDFGSKTSDKEFSPDPFKEKAVQRGSSVEGSFADFSSAFGTEEKESIKKQSEPVSQFADFEAANVLATEPPPAKLPSQKKPAPPPPDRYAALADLDSQLHQQAQPAAVMMQPANQPVIWSGGSAYCPVLYDAVGMPTMYGQPMQSCYQPVMNPYHHHHHCGQVPVHCMHNGIPNGTDVHQNGAAVWSNTPGSPWGYQGMPCEAVTKNIAPNDSYNNPWAQCVVSESANPFGNGSCGGAGAKPVPAKNPFL